MNDLATGSETRKRRSKFSKTVDAAIKDAEERLRDARLTLPEFLKRVSRANEKSFHKLETLGDKDQDENEDPTESGDDNLECSEDDEENYDMCAGFSRNKSAVLQLLDYVDDIYRARENQDISYFATIYIDFEKAFDKICHNILLRKLWSAGIQGST